MQKTAVVLLILACCSAMTAAASTDLMVNSSEPAFLHDIGPQNRRADDPWAAAIVAVSVVFIIWRGLRRHRRAKLQRTSSEE